MLSMHQYPSTASVCTGVIRRDTAWSHDLLETLLCKECQSALFFSVQWIWPIKSDHNAMALRAHRTHLP
jgi:hypothetical protein